jgi:hypothetical protein
MIHQKDHILTTSLLHLQKAADEAFFFGGVFAGWMQVRGTVRRRNADAGFALRDGADWKGLLKP